MKPSELSDSNLDVLEQLTPQLSALTTKSGHNFIEYTCRAGVCFGWNLYHVPEVAVQRAYLAKGTIFPEHTHSDATEILIVYRGRIKLNDTEYGPHDCAIIPSETVHGPEAIEETWMIAVCVPRIEGYPDEQRCGH